ncbi:hypothetical protein AB1Y20_014130 [Prymnesium parvum]|uniref:Uncharacterized protein n=1 Tax=Prymnesium parvum TaxID=97485 RepID=A0AB34IIG4_PRYPA
MVLSGGRGHLAFGFTACTGACCEPGGRQVATTRKVPLSVEQKLAFILCLTRRLGRPLLLPREVLRTIFDFSATEERRVVRMPSPRVSSLRMLDHPPEGQLQSLSLNAPPFLSLPSS